MFVNRTYRVVATAALGVAVLGACSDPDLNTDLRPDGPPEVLAVLVMTDASFQLVEKATYCKSNDEFRPGLVGLPDFTTTVVCPEDGSDPEEVTDAYPDGWYVRVMFDELLDPSIETLTPIIDETTGEPTGASTGSVAAAHPVTLECRSVISNEFVNVDYDGYYSPSGNRVTWPVGPSLVIKPNDPTVIATNTDCQIRLNDNILDKDGIPVPEAQRGPFPFKVAPITPIVVDPPADDPDYETPIDAVTLWYDNAYVQFNTDVDLSSVCPSDDGDLLDLCDNDFAFNFKDVEHPTEGPGYCADYSDTCSTSADCGGMLCGKGVCSDLATVCNTAADCATGEACNSTYAYNYVAYGGTATEFGIGPWNPLETNRKYTFELKEGTVLRDRCGRETTFGAPNVDDLTLSHFITSEFDFDSTTIVTGEVPSANKRLEFDFNNVLEGFDGTGQEAPSSWEDNLTITPMPKKLTAACSGTTPCPTADLDPSELLVSSVFANGQLEVVGHLQMDTEYTATLKAGAVIKDFYKATYTVPEDMVIKWKTQPTIQMTGIGVRNADTAFSTGDGGTLVKDGAAIRIRFLFNASIDPTTFDASDVKIVDAETGTAVPGLTLIGNAGAYGCGDFDSNADGSNPQCVLMLEGDIPAGDYTITFLKDAVVKDIFGATLTQPADTSIDVTIVDAPAPVQCL